VRKKKRWGGRGLRVKAGQPATGNLRRDSDRDTGFVEKRRGVGKKKKDQKRRGISVDNLRPHCVGYISGFSLSGLKRTTEN